jgi:hypothetical protein
LTQEQIFQVCSFMAANLEAMNKLSRAEAAAVVERETGISCDHTNLHRMVTTRGIDWEPRPGKRVVRTEAHDPRVDDVIEILAEVLTIQQQPVSATTTMKLGMARAKLDSLRKESAAA